MLVQCGRERGGGGKWSDPESCIKMPTEVQGKSGNKIADFISLVDLALFCQYFFLKILN
jgi:hypothetical protein